MNPKDIKDFIVYYLFLAFVVSLIPIYFLLLIIAWITYSIGTFGKWLFNKLGIGVK